MLLSVICLHGGVIFTILPPNVFLVPLFGNHHLTMTLGGASKFFNGSRVKAMRTGNPVYLLFIDSHFLRRLTLP